MSEEAYVAFFFTAMVTSIVGMVFVYKIIKVIVHRKTDSKKPTRSRMNSREFDSQSMDQIVNRAADLKRRVETLEEIIASERAKETS